MSTSTQKVTIQGSVYTMSAPYAEGYSLTAGEASAMNQLRAENVRNNFAAQIKKALEEGKTLGQAELTAYDESYEFGVRASGVRSITDPVEKAARELALKDVRGAIKAGGLKVKDFSDEKLESLVDDAIAQRPDYMERAKRAIAALKAKESAPALKLNLAA